MQKTIKQSKRAQKDKRPHSSKKATSDKEAVINRNPQRYLSEKPVWQFNRCDKEKWPVKTPDFIYRIFDKLADYEKMTWQEIQSASGGKTHGTNSHFENVADLDKAAQKRLLELKLDDTDQLFSLRLTGKERLYGILENGVFAVLWYDRKHEVYKVKK